MFKNKSFLFLISFFVFTQLVVSQNNTNSPYTRFGYGELVDNSSAEQRSMGGVAIGVRSNQTINTFNPASYSAVDSMTFMFDLGFSALYSRFTDPTTGKSTLTANLEYISMQFPLAKWLGFSAGLLPYSFLGYNFSSSDSVPLQTNSGTPNYVKYTKSFLGSGGFSQVFAGLSGNFFKHISLGMNAYYLFGTMYNDRYLSFTNTADNTSTLQYNNITAGSLRFRYGLQLYNTFAKKHDITLGFIYEPKIKLNGSFSQVTSGVLTDTLPGSSDFQLPEMMGGGLHYTYNNQFSLGIDYFTQKWGEATFFGKTDSLSNRSKISIGGEYIPNPTGRNFSDHVKYRAGFYISDAYYKLNGLQAPKNFGISVGVGLPLFNKATNTITMLNTSLEYGKIGSSSLLREDYLKLTVNLVFNEHWFFKRKL